MDGARGRKMCHAVAPHGAKGLKAWQVSELTMALPLLLSPFLLRPPIVYQIWLDTRSQNLRTLTLVKKKKESLINCFHISYRQC